MLHEKNNDMSEEKKLEIKEKELTLEGNKIKYYKVYNILPFDLKDVTLHKLCTCNWILLQFIFLQGMQTN